MATVTTTDAPTARPQRFEYAASTIAGDVSTQPIGKVVYAGNFTVATKDAANESEVHFSAVLPLGYFYRLSLIDIAPTTSVITALSPVTGFELAADGHVIENDVTVLHFPVVNLLTQNIGVDAVKIASDATTQDFGTFLGQGAGKGDIVSNYLIDATVGTSQLNIIWMDTSDDATVALGIQWRAEFMQFTIEQVRSVFPNAPILTYS